MTRPPLHRAPGHASLISRLAIALHLFHHPDSASRRQALLRTPRGGQTRKSDARSGNRQIDSWGRCEGATMQLILRRQAIRRQRIQRAISKLVRRRRTAETLQRTRAAQGGMRQLAEAGCSAN